MVNAKQLLAFYWTVHLGTVQKAADRLFVTQSAVTKRLQELERFAQVPLFVAGGPKHVLTAKGTELLHRCEGLVKALDGLEALRNREQLGKRILRMGITELVTVTWFSDFAARLRQGHPQVALHPDVDLSASLQRKLLDGEVDLAVIPHAYVTSTMRAVLLQSVEFAWLAPAGMPTAGRRLAMGELAQWPIIVQGQGSGITQRCERLFAEAGAEFERVYGSNSLFALVSLVRAGVGISCLPRGLFSSELRAGTLQALNVADGGSQVDYYLALRKDDTDALYPVVLDVCSRAVAAQVSAGGFAV